MEIKSSQCAGRALAGWTAEKDVLRTLKVEIPVNTPAEIYVPAPSAEVVASAEGLKPEGYANGYVKFVAGSGIYQFTVSGY